jgi:hypothetical protein
MVISSNSKGLISGIDGGQVVFSREAARAGKTAALTPAKVLVRKKCRRCGEPHAMTASSSGLNPVSPVQRACIGKPGIIGDWSPTRVNYLADALRGGGCEKREDRK